MSVVARMKGRPQGQAPIGSAVDFDDEETAALNAALFDLPDDVSDNAREGTDVQGSQDGSESVHGDHGRQQQVVAGDTSNEDEEGDNYSPGAVTRPPKLHRRVASCDPEDESHEHTSGSDADADDNDAPSQPDDNEDEDNDAVAEALAALAAARAARAARALHLARLRLHAEDDTPNSTAESHPSSAPPLPASGGALGPRSLGGPESGSDRDADGDTDPETPVPDDVVPAHGTRKRVRSPRLSSAGASQGRLKPGDREPLTTKRPRVPPTEQAPRTPARATRWVEKQMASGDGCAPALCAERNN